MLCSIISLPFTYSLVPKALVFNLPIDMAINPPCPIWFNVFVLSIPFSAPCIIQIDFPSNLPPPPTTHLL